MSPVSPRSKAQAPPRIDLLELRKALRDEAKRRLVGETERLQEELRLREIELREAKNSAG